MSMNHIFQFIVQIVPDGLSTIRHLCFNFIDCIVVDKLCHNNRFLILEKTDFLFHVLKSSFQYISLYFG